MNALIKMKRISALLLVALLSLTGVAQAQNVLLPTPAMTTVKTKSAAPTVTTDMTSSTQQAPILPNTLPNTPIPAATSQLTPALQTAAVYISPVQQKAMIEAEQKNLVAAQQNMAEIKQANASLSAQISTANQTPEQKQLLAQSQQSTWQTQAQLADLIKKSQQHLAILQAGPLKISDLSKLYQ